MPDLSFCTPNLSRGKLIKIFIFSLFFYFSWYVNIWTICFLEVGFHVSLRIIRCWLTLERLGFLKIITLGKGGGKGYRFFRFILLSPPTPVVKRGYKAIYKKEPRTIIIISNAPPFFKMEYLLYTKLLWTPLSKKR